MVKITDLIIKYNRERNQLWELAADVAAERNAEVYLMDVFNRPVLCMFLDPESESREHVEIPCSFEEGEWVPVAYTGLFKWAAERDTEFDRHYQELLSTKNTLDTFLSSRDEKYKNNPEQNEITQRLKDAVGEPI